MIYIILRCSYLLFSIIISLFHWAILSAGKLAGFLQPGKNVKGLVVTSLLERLGPTYIKLGQVISARPDVFGHGLTQHLSRLQCRVKPVTSKRVIKVIEKSFGCKYEQLFDEFDQKPMACGSIAQVHKAVLASGQSVAVKVQRPGLQNKMHLDFSILSGIGKVIERLPGFRHLPVCDLVRELKISIMAQLDFRREVNSLVTIKGNLKNIEDIYIPHVYPGFCNDSVIVMECVESLISGDIIQLPRNEKDELAITGLRMLFKMIFIDGFIHADLHKGNIFFQPGKIVVLDFGLTATLNRELRNQFRELFFAMVTNNGKACSRIILDTARSLPDDFDPYLFTETLSERLKLFSGKTVDDFEVVKFVSMIFDIQHQFRIRSSTDFTMTIISLIMFEGILKELAPELDFQREAIDILIKLPETSFTREERISVFDDLRNSLDKSIVARVN